MKVAAESEFHRSYQLGAKISQGSFSQLRVVRGKYAVEDKAVKVLDLRRRKEGEEVAEPQDVADAAWRKLAHRELAMWQKVGKHESCLCLEQAFFEGPWCYFLTEDVHYTFLCGLERLPTLNEGSLVEVFRQAFSALKHVHSLGLVHCDVRPDNLYFTSRGLNLKLAGFGSCHEVKNVHKLLCREESPWREVPFTSPELLCNEPFDTKTDIWSMGVIIYCLFYGQLPYKSKDKLLGGMAHAIKFGSVKPSFEPWAAMSQKDIAVSEAGTAFSKALLHRSPLVRPSAEVVLLLPYMTQAPNHSSTQSLAPAICGAIRAGAIGHNLPGDDTDVDYAMNYFQTRHHGPVHPWTKPQASVLKAALEKAHQRREERFGRRNSDASDNMGRLSSQFSTDLDGILQNRRRSSGPDLDHGTRLPTDDVLKRRSRRANSEAMSDHSNPLYEFSPPSTAAPTASHTREHSEAGDSEPLEEVISVI